LPAVQHGTNKQNLKRTQKKLNSQRINDPMKKRANEPNRALSKEEDKGS
jgi:hypothetical protein